MSDVLLYQATNTLEAQMIVDVLAQTGISARIQGAYLQGGIGELQALGVVRVMVDTQDYPQARQVADAWDATPVSAATDQDGAAPVRTVKPVRLLWGVLMGTVLAMVWIVFIASR